MKFSEYLLLLKKHEEQKALEEYLSAKAFLCGENNTDKFHF